MKKVSTPVLSKRNGSGRCHARSVDGSPAPYLADCGSMPLRGDADRLGFHRADGSAIHEQQVVSETRVQRKLAHRHPARRAQVGRGTILHRPTGGGEQLVDAGRGHVVRELALRDLLTKLATGLSIAHASRRIQTPNSQHIRVCGIMQKRRASSDLRHAASFLLHGSPGIRTRDQPVMHPTSVFTAPFGFVGWTIPSPWRPGRLPSSLYTFPVIGAWLGITMPNG